MVCWGLWKSRCLLVFEGNESGEGHWKFEAASGDGGWGIRRDSSRGRGVRRWVASMPGVIKLNVDGSFVGVRSGAGPILKD